MQSTIATPDVTDTKNCLFIKAHDVESSSGGLTAAFEDVPKRPRDPVFDLKQRYERDLTSTKVDLAIGVYRNEDEGCHELAVFQKVKMWAAYLIKTKANIS